MVRQRQRHVLQNCPQGNGRRGGPESNSIYRIDGLEESRLRLLPPTSDDDNSIIAEPVPVSRGGDDSSQEGCAGSGTGTPNGRDAEPSQPQPQPRAAHVPPSIDRGRHSENRGNVGDGHQVDHRMMISGCVLGLVLVVFAVAMFVMYRSRRNRRIPTGKGSATLGGGGRFEFVDVFHRHHPQQKQEQEQEQVGVRGGRAIQEWYPGMPREEGLEGCCSGQKRKSSIESRLFEGFDSSKVSLSETLRPIVVPTARDNDGNSASGSPILDASSGTSRRTIHTLNATPSSPSSPGTQIQMPVCPLPALRPLLSPISPALSHSASFSSISRGASLSPIQLPSNSSRVQQGPRLGSATSSIQQQLKHQPQQRRSQTIKGIILQGDDDPSQHLHP